MKILVAAIGSLAGEPLNGAELLMGSLPEQYGVHSLTKRRLPLEFEKGKELLRSWLSEEFDLILCLGHSRERKLFALERVAVNLMDVRGADDTGFAPRELPAEPEGPAACLARYSVRTVTEELRSKGVPVRLSDSAGTHVCNSFFYELLYRTRKEGLATQAAFVHVPSIGAGAMTLEEGLWALLEILEGVGRACTAGCFAGRPQRPMELSLRNRKEERLTVTLRSLQESDLEAALALQREVHEAILDNETKNLLQPVTAEEMKRALTGGACVGVFGAGKRLLAQVNLLPEPLPEENVALDLLPELVIPRPAIVDYVAVSPAVRGFGLQRLLLQTAEKLAEARGLTDLCAVTSPLNAHSIRNFTRSGYRIVATKPKYRSERHYLWKKIVN